MQQPAQRGVTETAAGNGLGRQLVIALPGVTLITGHEFIPQAFSQITKHLFTGLVNGSNISLLRQLNEIGL